MSDGQKAAIFEWMQERQLKMNRGNENCIKFGYINKYCYLHTKEWWKDWEDQFIGPVSEAIRPRED